MHNIDIDDLTSQLLSSKVNFSFLKKDGEMRTVNATLKEDLIPEDLRSKNKLKKSNLSFFDLDKSEWRSLAKDVTIVTIYE